MKRYEYVYGSQIPHGKIVWIKCLDCGWESNARYPENKHLLIDEYDCHICFNNRMRPPSPDPCPCCDLSVYEAYPPKIIQVDKNAWRVECQHCGMAGAATETEDGAIVSWNNRPTEYRLRMEINILKNMSLDKIAEWQKQK